MRRSRSLLPSTRKLIGLFSCHQNIAASYRDPNKSLLRIPGQGLTIDPQTHEWKNEWAKEDSRNSSNLLRVRGASCLYRPPLTTHRIQIHSYSPYLCPSNVTLNLAFTAFLQLIHNHCFGWQRSILHLGPDLGKKSEGKVSLQGFIKWSQSPSPAYLVRSCDCPSHGIQKCHLWVGAVRAKVRSIKLSVTRNVPINQHGSQSENKVPQRCDIWAMCLLLWNL